MEKKRALELLKQALNEIPRLKELDYDNQDFKLWRNDIMNVIDATLDAKDYLKINNADHGKFSSKRIVELMPDDIRHDEYLENLKNLETALSSIINKYELIGVEDKPRIQKYQTSGINSESNGLLKTPIQLFDAIQLHPKVIEASRPCFVTGNYREAILNAFICLIDHIKEITGLDIDGDDLVNQVFSYDYDKIKRKVTKYPIIRINELRTSNDRNEQEGFKYLCKGAAAGIRNPKAHKLTAQSNPFHTLEYLSLASLLFRRIEEGKVVKPPPPREKWDWNKFISNLKSKCSPEITSLAEKLYEFTEEISSSISWGTGTKDGSFTFRKTGLYGTNSIVNMYTYGNIYIYLTSLINKKVPYNIIETFISNLNKIPNINIPREAIKSGKYIRINEKTLTRPENFNLFKDAVVILCHQLDY